MDDRFNTIAGWTLFAGIVALGASLASSEYFKGERPEKMGFAIEGVEAEGGDAAVADKPIEFYLASADVAKGEETFKKCAACHNADKGGPNALGPNLWGVLGEPIGKGAGGFAFSDALSGKGGNWEWHSLNDWLTSPKKFAPGTKMTFAGLGNGQDRANVIAFLNAHGDSPLPMPAAPAEAAAPAAGDKAGAATAGKEADGSTAQKAGNVPVLTEQQAAKGDGVKSIGGEGAAKVTGSNDAKKQ